jgi:hypothetical protein
MADDTDLTTFATTNGTSVAAARGLLNDLRGRVGAGQGYVFWAAGGGGAGGQAQRQRTLLAFRTPDAALSFAQRNQLGRGSDQPRLRRLSLLQLLQAVLREPAITALLLVDEAGDEQLPAGRLPPGIRIERAELLRRLHETTP